MKQIGRLMMLCVLSVTLTGCGTYIGRANAPHFGAYPYEEVLSDCVMIRYFYYQRDAPLLVGCVASIPFDAVLDTLLLPVDLPFWVAGKHKFSRLRPH